MKPGVSLVTTGDLPQASIIVLARSTCAASVCRAGTTSTKAIKGAGLKKCSPMKRSGCCSLPAMAVTLSEEVLVARTASGATIVSKD